MTCFLLKIKIWMQITEFSLHVSLTSQIFKNPFAQKTSIDIWNNNQVWTPFDNIMIGLATDIHKRSDLHNADDFWK